jgi:predicted acetyltransferase
MNGGALRPDAGESEPSGSRRRIRSSIILGNAGDHPAIHHFLTGVFGGPSQAEFNASVQDPFYEPTDRLLLRRAGQIFAHVHLTHRVMHFGPVKVPVAGLGWLATSPRCRHEGLGTYLMTAAERRMAESGAMIGLLRTRIPHFFRRTGWALCGRPTCCAAGAHAVLACLLERGMNPHRHHRLHIRPWRRWEECGLARVYQQNVAGSYGPLERSRAYWHWLLERRGFEQIYVALDGPDPWDLQETSTQLVGYAAVHGSQIVELMTAPDRRKAAWELLARVCGDAVEHDHQTIVLHGPCGSPIFDIFDEAGGRQIGHASGHEEVLMARLLNPIGLLRSLRSEFLRRAQDAGFGRGVELGLMVEGRKFQIEIRRDRTEVAESQIGRSYLRMNVADFTRLVLGQLDWDVSLAEGRVQPSTAIARDAGLALFPPLPLWRPPLDDLMG